MNNRIFTIDVVLPFHIINNYLHEAITSVEKSTGVHTRLILVNDTRSGSYLEQYPLNIDAIEVYTDTPGYLSALAKGISSSSSEFIGFLDSDDITSPERFANQTKHLVDSGADLSTGVLRTINSTGKVIPKRPVLGKMPTPNEPRELLLLGSHGADSALVGRGDFIRQSWNTHSTFPPSLADFGWFFSLPQGTKVVHTANAIYYYRSHESQMSRSNGLLLDWSHVYPKYLEHQNCNFSGLRFLNLNEYPPNVLAALIFPSSMPKLTSGQKKALFVARNSILSSLENRGEERSQIAIWRKTLNRRCFIATREIRPSLLSGALMVVIDLCFNRIYKVRSRNNA